MEKSISKNQALLTAIGLMIGSGIFFRADNIVSSTQGNVMIGIIAWIVMGSTLVFAGIAISSIASRTKQNGGLIGYIEDHFGKKWAFIVGWYQIVVYIPIMLAVLTTVFVDYACQLFSITLTDTQNFIAWVVVLVAAITWNILSTKIAALISSTATIVKVIPLILIAILGFVLGDPTSISTTAVAPLVEGPDKTTLALFFAPLLSMAFAFDGWITVGSLSVDMENPQKDLPQVFVLSVIITTIVYTLYFAGVNAVLDPQTIVESGNGHVAIVAGKLLGESFGPTFVLTCVVISVLGTLNAIVMAGGRYVSKMGENGLLPGSDKFKQLSKYSTPANSLIFVGIIAFVAQVLYYMQAMGVGFLQGIVLDDIPMVINSLIYLMLFWAVVRLGRQGEISAFRGYVVPALASLGQLIIVFGFFIQADNIFVPTLYIIVSFVIIALGFVICRNEIKDL